MTNICFILIRPRLPENVGAAARALKTMGFCDLRIVGSAAHAAPAARALAHGSTDILDACTAYATLDAALHDCDFCVGTTARRRNRRTDYHTPDAVFKIICEKGRAINRAAFVFGPEETGLFNDEIDRCDIMSSIPMKSRQPSLNLGQAVMIYAYELSTAVLRKPVAKRPHRNDSHQLELLKQKCECLLPELGYPLQSPRYRRIMERLSLLKGIDMQLTHAVANRIGRKCGG